MSNYSISNENLDDSARPLFNIAGLESDPDPDVAEKAWEDENQRLLDLEEYGSPALAKARPSDVASFWDRQDVRGAALQDLERHAAGIMHRLTDKRGDVTDADIDYLRRFLGIRPEEAAAAMKSGELFQLLHEIYRKREAYLDLVSTAILTGAHPSERTSQ